MPFEFEKLEIPDIILVKPKIFYDERGFFLEIFKHSEFNKNGITENFEQDNYSKSVKNVLRGMHYQKSPFEQAKFIKCLRGKIFDAVIDIRKESSTYGKWVGMELSEDNQNMLFIPSGFAHGFVVLSDTAEVLYKCSKEYSPKDERGIIWNDPDIKINWPVANPILIEKDKQFPRLKDAYENI